MEKKDDTEVQDTAEVVELLEEEHINLEVVRWAAGEKEPSPEKKKWLDQVHKERGDGFYSDLIFTLLNRRYPLPKAYVMWNEIISHRDLLAEALGRNPGIVVAALDLLTNLKDDRAMEISLIENSRLESMLERAVVDGLTGLYDHDTFLTLLDKEIERAKRYSETVSLLMLDLDDFKQINDELGHQKGDEVLARVANIIQETIRTMDIAGRYGGEEFAVILPEANLSKAVQSAQRLCKAVEAQFRQDVRLTVSMGVACFPDQSSELSTLVKMADEALYQAKAEGKNRVVTK